MHDARMRLVVIVLGALCVAGGAGLAVHGWNAHRQVAAFRSAPRCAARVSSGCWAQQPAKVVRTFWARHPNGPAVPAVMLTAGGARRTVQLAVHRQWAMLYPGEAVQLVRYGGYTIGLNAGGALYASDDYPGYRATYAAIFAAMLLGWGLGLLAYARLGRIVPAAALVVPPTAGAVAWIVSRSPALTAAGAVAGLAAVVLVAWALRRRRRVDVRPAAPAWGLGIALVLGIVMLAGLAPAASTAPVDCSQVSAAGRPQAGVCQTTLAQFAAALHAGGLTPVTARAGPSCTPIGGVWKRGLTPAGVVRSLRSAGIAAQVYGPAAGTRFGWLAGPHAAAYVVSAPAARVPRSGLFVIGVYPTAHAAGAGWSAMGQLPGVSARLLPMYLQQNSSFQSVNQGDNLVYFNLFSAPKHPTVVDDAVVRAELGCAR